MDVVLSVLHVVTAVFLVGPMAVIPMTALRSLRSGYPEQTAALGKSTRLYSLLSLAVVVFGFGVMAMADPKYHLSIATPWILTSLVLYAAALGLNLLVVAPALIRTTPGAPRKGYRRVAIGSGAVALLLLAVTALMVWKP